MYTVKLPPEAKIYKMSPTFGVPDYLIPAYTRFSLDPNVSDVRMFVNSYKERVQSALKSEYDSSPFTPFAWGKTSEENQQWLEDNNTRFFEDTKNSVLSTNAFLSEYGFICSMAYSSKGNTIIVGHSSGLIQMRHGLTGTVLSTLRNIQFPAKPVHALEYSRYEENICYAACTDGVVYRIEIPHVDTSVTNPPKYCIRADPALESLNTQFYGSPGISSCCSSFITQRSPALALGLLADGKRMAVGYGNTAIKIFDIETQEAETTYQVHKLRLQFIPKKLQRMHFGQVVALRAHPEKPYMFVSGAWDKTLRVWDVRCKVGCVTTFEGVDICSDSLDVNREHCLVGSWQPTEALTLWDLTAKKRLAIIRVQNRRPDVDGEYIYACRYWRSNDYNRKGKYGIIGGSGTNCVEVINLHNRYITCSYPAKGSILAVTSHEERIAFGGTSSNFTIATFHDPKHEKEAYMPEVEPDYDYTNELKNEEEASHDFPSTVGVEAIGEQGLNSSLTSEETTLPIEGASA